MAFLRAIKGLEAGRIFELNEGTVILGRNPKRCQIVLEHYAVSREHARIDIAGDTTFIEDMSSRNGVLVNGLPIQPGVAGRQRLLPHDRIEIAAFEFVFEEQPSSDGIVLLEDERDTKLDILSTVNVAADATHATRPGVRAIQLRTILSIIEDLAQAIDLDDVLPRIIETLLRSFSQAQNACLLLRNGESGEFAPAAVRRKDGGTEPICIRRLIVDEVVRNRSAVLTGLAGNPEGEAAGQLGSAISAPLAGSDGELLGLIQLEVADGPGTFSENDLDLLAGVARHVAIVIENSRLHDAALRAQRLQFEAQFRGLIEGSVQGILIHRNFEPLFVNEAYARLHGLTVDEVMDMPSVLALIPPADRERAMSAASSRMQGGGASDRHEIQALRPDGSTLWLEESATLVEWTGGPAIQTAVVDITARKQAEEVLRRGHDELERLVEQRARELADTNRRLQAEIEERRHAVEELRQAVARYHSLVDHIPLCVARKNSHGEFTFVNKALADLFRQSEEQIVGRTDFDFFPDEMAAKYRRDDEQVMQSGELLELYETFRTPEGELRHIHTLKTPICDAEGNCTGIQLIFSDVTSVKRAEEEKHRYAAELERSNRELEQFAYSVSHDLQSPLRTVASYCQLLQRRYHGQLDDEADEFVAGAVDGARRMKRLLDDLLAYCRAATDKTLFRPVAVEKTLEEALRNLRSLVVENDAVVTHDPLPSVTADATQLMQLFQNLIGNAIRYRGPQAPRIHVHASERSDEWVFSVKDNGMGIDPKHFERIFQVFQRLHGDSEITGSGIGLAICKRIAERHGGRIWVASCPGAGSEFFFALHKKLDDVER